ncbi:hypothetical protein [Myxococcus qinghaiensis]|uniref:hypothetical protein n=1 Tax=Myxococcus qinghaiensis TaxID=2906758 RepID=UPI0020A7B09A|nr:hypothetical protein [Myxococcus qinghaiensis]MCP3162765.1 hypothetical protein [Myxococcus qinghaiensis]
MHSSSVVPSRLFTLGGGALLAVWLSMSACRQSDPPLASESPPPSTAAVSPPLDVQAVVRRAERAFRAGKTGAFSGDQDTYSLSVEPDGSLVLVPRHLVEGVASPADASRAPGKVTARPVTSAPLRVRTVEVSRGGRSLLEGLEASVRKDGALALARGPVVEVLENGDVGVEQRWEWATQPEGTGDLEIRVAVEGLEYAGVTEHGHHFVDPVTRLGARYGRATWVDAAGRRTDVETVREARALVMRVPARVLEGSAWPAVLDPVVSPEIDLDVPLPVPNALSNTESAVAFGGGVYLVAWQNRIFTQDELLFARVRASDGQVLDVGSLALALGTGDQRFVAVASNGNDFLLAWEDSQVSSTTGPYSDLKGARVRGADGRLLDPMHLILSASVGDERRPAIASNGTDYLVVWEDDRRMYNTPDVRGTRVRASDGAILDVGGRFIAGGYNATNHWLPQVAYAQGHYLVTFTNGDLRGTRVRASDMAVLDGNSGFIISTSANIQAQGNLAFDGELFLVVWTDFRNGSSNPDIFAARVRPDGTVLDPTGLAISTAANRQEGGTVASAEYGFLVAWQHTVSSNVTDIHVARVGRDGVVGGSRTVGQPSSVSDQEKMPALASGRGGTFFVAWNETRPTSHSVVSGALLDVFGGMLSAEQMLSADVSAEQAPATAYANGTYLVVWQDNRARSNVSDILGARVRASDGVVLDDPPLLIATSARLEELPSVATDGSQFLVVFQHRSETVSDSSNIFGVRVRASDGVVLDGTMIPISTAVRDQRAPLVSFAGGYYLVVWTDFRTGGLYSDIYAARVRASDGVAMDPQGIAVSTAAADQLSPVVVSGGEQFFVVWQDRRVSNLSDVYGARVRASDGVVLDASGIAVATDTWGEVSPTVAFDGSHYLVAWEDQRFADGTIQGRRVRASDGVALTPARIPLASAPVHPLQSTLAFDGMRYLLVWNRDYVSYSEVMLHGRRFTPEVVPVDATSFLITDNAPLGAGRIAAASSEPGRFLVAYSDYRLFPRIRARLVSDLLPTGNPCSLWNECESGFCVDGVCCDKYCGGGAGTDCQACSVAAGAGADGVCGAVRAEVAKVCRPVAGGCDVAEACDGVGVACPVDGFVGAGVECRPAAHACDVAETCGGQAVACPDDALAEDGTACVDASACTLSDTCQSGVCKGAEPVVCTAPNPCMRAGVCDSETGVCSPPEPVADGTACDDGNACTQSDTCQAGACTGADPVMCGASDVCHSEGSCNPSTGVCSNPEREDGSVCAGGACESGVCVPTPDAGSAPDAGTEDAGTEQDAGAQDAGGLDAGAPTDAGEPDAGVQDAGAFDAGTPPDADSGSSPQDSGTGPDAGPSLDAGANDPDAGADAGAGDAGTGPSPDAGPGNSDAGSLPGGVPPAEETMGCGCGVPAGSSNLGLLTLLAGAVFLRAARRRHG